MKNNNKKLLLHICCAGCGSYVGQLLEQEGFEVLLYFFNPGIFPVSEYNIRRDEVKNVAGKFAWPFFLGEYDHAGWLAQIKGLEDEVEKGERCFLCYEDRLRQTAIMAEKLQCKFFASTLSVSPHKVVEKINLLGERLSKEYSLAFLSKDFKKQDGFKKAALLSRELNLYRQSYCGCEFSVRKQ